MIITVAKQQRLEILVERTNGTSQDNNIQYKLLGNNIHLLS
uniref:Uncharacterized protein n=1 Tax=White spot syndrome virus TaxID=342409 RepID=A0A6B9MDJ5_9VIRU|nr:hypothetical protein [White spot syndrome virus]